MGKRVFITGGTGFLGRAIVAALRARGDTAIVVTRNVERAQRLLDTKAKTPIEIVEGDPVYAGRWQEALLGVDAVINLAGQSIAGKRWTAHYKQLLHDSRVETTRLVVEGMAGQIDDDRPRVLVSASGIDYYPFAVDLGYALPVDEDDVVDETVPSGDTFLARVCRNWEAEAREAEQDGVRVVCMRTALVLGHGGPLDKMTGPFRFFVGGRIGSGRQWFSWVHIDDAVAAYLFALDRDELSGPVNLVAPQSTRAGAFAKALGKAMRRPSWLPVPGFAMKSAVGEFSEYVLHGRRAVPRALQDAGFEFTHGDLASALGQLYP